MKFIAAGLPILLATTGSFAADLGKVSIAGPGYALSATEGVAAFSMPATDAGVNASGSGSFETGSSTFATGLQGGISGSVEIGKAGDASFSLGFNAFSTLASGSSLSTDKFTGAGTVVIPGYTTPAGSITLTTNSTPKATAAVAGTGALDQNVTATGGGGGTADAFGYVPGANSFSMMDASHSATTGASYGAIATSAGGIFVGTGDLTGLKVTTTNTQSIVYNGADISFAATANPTEGMVLQGYVGPSYRFLSQHNATSITADIPAQTGAATGLVLPSYSDNRTEDLTTNYLGALAGLNLTTKVADGVNLTVGGQAGIYHLRTGYSGSESFAIGGGSGTAGSLVLPLATQTVANANTISGAADGTAYSASLNGAVTIALSNRLQLTFGGTAEYLSAVPVLHHNTNVSTVSGSGGADTTYSGTSTQNPLLAFADMWDYGLTVSLTGQF